ncbi:MAG: L-glutamate gamma-semialdehyde dehydrogenase [Firmicutes bacterium]|nr:L-glutamate gamma-semialdehyde dehydrogenase [Bacillota bacterium]
MQLLPFQNQRPLDFTQPETLRAMQEALQRTRAAFPLQIPAVVDGQKVDTAEKIESYNPCRKEGLVAVAAKGDRALADQALQAAWQAFETWQMTPAEVRARYLLATAAEMRRRRYDLCALEVLEAGKSWSEADGDVNEAIDFLEYYARESVRMAQPVATAPYPGEENTSQYIPLGVGLILPPWNFPLAILTGMTMGPVAVGNTVILKPASPTPAIGYQLAAILQEVGLPKGVVNFLPGSGSEVGEYLARHPQMRFISFTGSREVGTHLFEVGGQVVEGQRWLKRVVAEMGGKDAIVVDESADLDAAADGIVTSAFGYQGQKCSACSRVIAVDAVYDTLLEKLVTKTQALQVGPAEDPKTQVAAVISAQQYEKVLQYVEIAQTEGRVVVGGHAGDPSGYYIEPTLVADVDPNARIAQEEIFGPVVACLRAPNFEAAIDIANQTVYGLTGAVYSRNRKHLEYAREHFFVGNLYFNRKCTGSLVGVHPFGGFNLSGTDVKTGSPEYLLHFMQMKSVSEAL